MIHRGLVLIAFACCGLVLASFVLFARDQVAGASIHQQSELAVGALRSPGVATRGSHTAQPRRMIDGAAHTLTSPFRSIVQTNSQWVLHAVPTIFALLAYGLGLGFLARFSRGIA